MSERIVDIEGQVRWEGGNSAWGKLLRESETQGSGYSQNMRMQGNSCIVRQGCPTISFGIF
ncbi:TPA: hypothetical protein ACIJZ3_001338 [Enterobacter cloacae]